VSEPWPIHCSGSGSGETCHIFTEIFFWIFYENTRMIVFMILFLFQIICHTWNELSFLLSAVRPVVHQYTIPVWN